MFSVYWTNRSSYQHTWRQKAYLFSFMQVFTQYRVICFSDSRVESALNFEILTKNSTEVSFAQSSHKRVVIHIEQKLIEEHLFPASTYSLISYKKFLLLFCSSLSAIGVTVSHTATPMLLYCRTYFGNDATSCFSFH